ncbi:hypothetical protein BRYFOR_07009 [Marvinbryantia formatexigens DSM 14469]|uniref:ABC-2 family transporter protein n=1 Tax=Marvinbryantia formatexigens DSM 14469 TaxID=478749 RepID=C6LEG0_9FIRM|nr:hypothetical protein [Marvinbryantia formatexigens]EET60943.1 hypothetical protein BRYFOR_07009 [Marvinbryantia formatexigens DSM 14469]UWO24761.1 hypothetical protein NQ534_20510 [Marvinbryantia formatexigens DSM 14469]SDF22300.1 hypothetical protein SAMN05660368_00377 [Marvinbryantia formatexigens]
MDLVRMLHEKKFYLAILLAFFGVTAGAELPGAQETLPAGTFLKLTTAGMKSQTALFLLPVASVLPCAEEYLRERQWNFLRVLIVRRSKKEYCRDRVLTTALSGALVWSVAAVLAALFFFLLFFAREEAFSWQQELVEELLRTLARICLTASALAGFAAFTGAVGGSVYLAFGLPFIVFYAGIILRQRYLEDLYCIDPSEWILAENNWGCGQYALWIFLILLALCMAALHRLILEKRLEEI